ncbi:unnamed protein product [Microthlaspi erraticum]|uniref:Cyclin-dependent kinase inhibitor n=1 Tax=Microthlaspi erraticum TaxID=1685480 RepID=A0A6D2KYQ0_9BRAS|nr:unnamed protein product [Microthlaspi erraticum]CAA7052976.1 unnamed protein product [Microthlaspi erraticum]
MSERNSDLKKRDAEETEASSTTVSPPEKKKKLDDSSAESHAVVVVVPVIPPSPVASSADSAQGGRSVTSAGEDDGQSSSICSDSVSSKSNEIAATKSPTSVVDLEAHQISETESSTVTARKFSKEGNPESEALGEITDMEPSPVTKKDGGQEVRKKPTAEEIEEFFSELGDDDEKQKRFTEKYNFDIVNDKPLEGRYKWDRVEP